MEITTTRGAGAALETMPPCPECGLNMIVRAQWSNGHVQGLNWVCRRAPGCEGVRRIRRPNEIRPINHDASTQAIFDWESSHDTRSHDTRLRARREPRGASGQTLSGAIGRLFNRSGQTADYDEAAQLHGSMGYFDGLVEQGFVALEDRGLSSARVAMDNVLVGPSGVFVIERKSWAGNLAIAADVVYVDGRQRLGATDQILRATAAFEQTMAHELKPVGATVRPAMLFENATNKSVEGAVDKVLVGGTRGLPKLLRGTAEPILGPETIIRLALAADRLLE
ncbi:MAG: nuclease-related domain-containing protein [Chloroflexota bacterium]